MRRINPTLRKVLIAIFWILVWEVVATVVGNDHILVTVDAVALELIKLSMLKSFWSTVLIFFVKNLLGIIVGSVVAILLASLCYKVKVLGDFIKPLVRLIKAVPIVCFTYLFLMWWGNYNTALPVAFSVSFVSVLPIVFVAFIDGLDSTDAKVLEMAKVYRLSFSARVFYIYRPTIKRRVIDAFREAITLAFKAGIVGEVLTVATNSVGIAIGNTFHVEHNIAGLTAWTFVLMLISFLFNRLMQFLLYRLFDKRIRVAPQKEPHKRVVSGVTIGFEGVTKIIEDKAVLEHYNASYVPHQISYMTTPSGSGKTTKFRLLAGIETADSGVVNTVDSVSYMFSDDRLIPFISPVENVAFITGDWANSVFLLEKLIDSSMLSKPVSTLDDLTKKKVALVQAMAADSDLILLDEPYEGQSMDDARRMASFIEEFSNGRTIIIASQLPI